MQSLNTSLLLVHAENDWEIPSTHSETLFNALLEPMLPPLPVPPSTPGGWSTEEWSAFADRQLTRSAKREKLVTRTSIPNFGTLESFHRSDGGGGGGGSEVMFLKTLRGGHKRVGTIEAVHFTIRSVFHV